MIWVTTIIFNGLSIALAVVMFYYFRGGWIETFVMSGLPITLLF